MGKRRISDKPPDMGVAETGSPRFEVPPPFRARPTCSARPPSSGFACPSGAASSSGRPSKSHRRASWLRSRPSSPRWSTSSAATAAGDAASDWPGLSAAGIRVRRRRGRVHGVCRSGSWALARERASAPPKARMHSRTPAVEVRMLRGEDCMTEPTLIAARADAEVAAPP